MHDLMKLYGECVEEMKRINMDISNRIVGIKINSRLSRTLGRCVYSHLNGNYIIEVAPCMLKNGVEVKAVKDTIIHELIHTCPNCMNHGWEWKRRADRVNRMLGYSISRCATTSELEADGVEVKKPVYKYALECKECGKQYMYKRWCDSLEYPNRYRCGVCNGEFKTVGLNGNRVWDMQGWYCAANRVK